MKSEAKRKKRLLLIAGAAVACALAAGAAFLVRRIQLDRRALGARDAGRAALASGDMKAALDGLGTYIQRFGDRSATSEDYLLYARARRRVELPNGKHLAAATAMLRKALDLDPASREVEDELLSLYVETHYESEAVELIGRMLDDTPGDVDLLRTKADILEAAGRFAAALEVARSLNTSNPEDFDDLVRTLRLLGRTDAPRQAVDDWLAKLAQAHPADPGIDLLRATVLAQRRELKRATQILDYVFAGVATMSDPKRLAFLARTLDGQRRFDDALHVLERMKAAGDPAVRRELVRRYWFLGRSEDVIAASQPAIVDLERADAEILAIDALALSVVGRKPGSKSIRNVLAARTDAAGIAWASFVEQAFHEGSFDARETAEAMQRAVAAVPDGALLHAVLGDARAAQGESDAAIGAWTVAQSLAPMWAYPLTKIAQVSHALGRYDLARSKAREALAREPNNPGVIALLLQVSADASGGVTDPDLLLQVEKVTADVPMTSQAMLPVRVALLARTDRAKAEAALNDVLTSKSVVSEATLLQLADVAAEFGLARESDFLDLSERVNGPSPRIALARAIVTSRSVRPDGAEAGLATFDDARTRAKSAGSDLDWQVARATYLDAVGRSDAGAAWTALADANPAALHAQLGALASPSLWANRDAVARVIDRVKDLTGPRGVTWRTSRARWLINAPKAAENDVANGAAILADVVRDAPDNVPAHLLFAQALEKLGNLDGAGQQIQLASNLAPDDPWIALEVARLAQRRGEPDTARQTLDAVLSAKDLAPAQSERAAYLLAAQGDLGRSADLLEGLAKQSKTNRDGTLLLAQLYGKLGRTGEAIALCEGLMDRPTPALIELCADLYRAAGRAADAESALARLEGMNLPAGDRELARARHASRWGPPGGAQEWFRKAIDAAPDRSDAWTAYLRFVVAAGDRTALLALLDDPRAAVVEGVRYLSEIRALCAAAVGDAALRSLVLAVIDDKASRTVLVEVLQAAEDASSDAGRRAAAAVTVRRIADRSPGVLAVQMLAAELCAQTGELRTACDIAQRTSAAFPSSSGAAEQAARLCARSERWNDALEAGLRWRTTAGRQDAKPDVFVAGMRLKLGQPAEAASTLDAHAARAIANPDENEGLLLTYAAALSRSGQKSRAVELLRTLASKSERWRTLPLSVSAEWMGNTAEAVAWLEACDGLVPESDVRGRLKLAQEWAVAWQKFGAAELLERTKSELSKLTSAAVVPVEARFMAGALAQQAGDLEGARAAYELALKTDANFAAARNNLSMVLADAGKWEAAVDHAIQITKAFPRSTQFLDTLAYAYRKGRKFDDAIACLDRAIALEPTNPAWRVSLAETLRESGDVAASDRTVTQIRQMAAEGAPFPPALRARFDKLTRH